MRRGLSKRRRMLLWVAASGKCQSCATPIDHTFHADHIVPFSISRDTNIHAMQALCPACNLKKGAKICL